MPPHKLIVGVALFSTFLALSASQAQWVSIPSVTSKTVNYHLSNSSVTAVDTRTGKVLREATLEPNVQALWQVNGVILVESASSGAYLWHRVQALKASNGQPLWSFGGALGEKSKSYVLLLNDFPFRDDQKGSYFQEFIVVEVASGKNKVMQVQVPPRPACHGQVSFERAVTINLKAVKAVFADSCGVFLKTLR